jgi:enoyl-CoA hydratase/carnithine racemase
MPELSLETRDSVAVVTLSRPERRNALSRSLVRELVRAARALAADTSVRVVVLQAEGADFSVGVDLKDPEWAQVMGLPLRERRSALTLGPEVVAALRAIPQTTVVAMHGYCLGGGGCLALACDLRVASADVQFGMPEVLRGMNMSWKTVPLMVETFGPTRTKELLLTPCYVGGDRALAWGLANRVVAGGAAEARAEALRWARQIAEEVPPLAAAMVKETVDAVVALRSPVVHMDGDQYALLQGSEEQAEALSAFLQKRKPRF